MAVKSNNEITTAASRITQYRTTKLLNLSLQHLEVEYGDFEQPRDAKIWG